MLSLRDSMQVFEKYEQAYPMSYPWNDTSKTDVARYYRDSDGWWKNPAALPSGKALLCCTGDLICEPRLIRANRYGDSVFFHPLFQFARPIFRQADFVIGNLETTVSDYTPDAGAFHTVAGKYHCNTTESFLDALRYAGFDGVVNANNHNCDSGAAGLIQTNERLDSHGFLRTGTFLPGQEDRAALVEINGIRVAILSYATYFNRQEGNFTKLGQAMLNPFSAERARVDVAWAKQHGAEYVLSYIHWGKEYIHYPTDLQKEQAQALADAGVDYIVGSHSHCLQVNDCITAADGRAVPVVYSMGNFITNESKDLCRHSGILQILLEKTEAGLQVTDYFVPGYIFDAFETARYGCVLADPLLNGGYDHPELHRSRRFVQELISIPEPVSCAITVPQLCQLWDIPVPEGMEYTVISGICTQAEHIRERQAYFSDGTETKHQKLCLFRRRPILMVTETADPKCPCLVVPDVRKAYHMLIMHLRSRINCDFITVAGKENKTVTADFITRTLRSTYRTHSGAADHSWIYLHPSHRWCVQELREREFFGYPKLNPKICVITSYIPDLPQLLETLADDTLLLYYGDDAVLTSALAHKQNKLAFYATTFPGLRMEVAAGAAQAVEKQLGLPVLTDCRYMGMEQNIYVLDGVTVMTDYACKSAESAKQSLAALAACTGKRIAVVEETYASFARAEVVIPVAEPAQERTDRAAAEAALEQQILAQLEPGCTVLLCGGRHLALNLTLRRVFGLTDGAITDLT